MNTSCAPRLGRSTTTLPPSPSMRHLRTCSFFRPCASALLSFLPLPPSTSLSPSFSLLAFSSSFPSSVQSPLALAFLLQIKVGRKFMGNHLSADSVLVCHLSQENRITIKLQIAPELSAIQPNLSDTGSPTRQHIPADIRLPTHVQQRTAWSGFS